MITILTNTLDPPGDNPPENVDSHAALMAELEWAVASKVRWVNRQIFGK